MDISRARESKGLLLVSDVSICFRLIGHGFLGVSILSVAGCVPFCRLRCDAHFFFFQLFALDPDALQGLSPTVSPEY